MSFDEGDGRITMSIPSVGIDDYEVYSHKDGEFVPGDANNSVTGAKGVIYHVQGARKPTFGFMPVDGVEAAKVRKMCLDRNGRARKDIQLSWTFRRDGKSLVTRFTRCMLGEGGGLKASDAEGLTSQGAMKFLAKSVTQSINGGAFTRVA